MDYPLKSGWYCKKENGKLLYVISEEEGLVHCEQEGRRFAVLASEFVDRWEKSKTILVPYDKNEK